VRTKLFLAAVDHCPAGLTYVPARDFDPVKVGAGRNEKTKQNGAKGYIKSI
jgi:hypothetical protein